MLKEKGKSASCVKIHTSDVCEHGCGSKLYKISVDSSVKLKANTSLNFSFIVLLQLLNF